MCESGINADQLRMSITQTEQTLGLAQEWLEELHHLADHGKKHDASVELAQATVLLGEARVKLEKAIDRLGGAAPADGVTVELV
jgi:hypothetical protein